MVEIVCHFLMTNTYQCLQCESILAHTKGWLHNQVNENRCFCCIDHLSYYLQFSQEVANGFFACSIDLAAVQMHNKIWLSILCCKLVNGDQSLPSFQKHTQDDIAGLHVGLYMENISKQLIVYFIYSGFCHIFLTKNLLILLRSSFVLSNSVLAFRGIISVSDVLFHSPIGGSSHLSPSVCVRTVKFQGQQSSTHHVQPVDVDYVISRIAMVTKDPDHISNRKICIRSLSGRKKNKNQ